MKKFKDFENAPVGATATTALGRRAMKIDDGEQCWITPSGNRYNDGGMVFWDYTLDPPAPTSAREALDLAWELAHEVKEGQVVPTGTRLLDRPSHSIFSAYMTQANVTINEWESLTIRTLEPLPAPEPDWLNAPAVLAHTDNNDTRSVWTVRNDGLWVSTSHAYAHHWRELRDVTPLYPKGQEA